MTVFDWVDGAAIGNNIVAGIITGLATIFGTYKIVQMLLKRAEEARWKRPREAFLKRLKGSNETTMLIWSFIKDPNLLPPGLNITPDIYPKLKDAMRAEVEELKPYAPLFQNRRTDAYWIDVARGLGSSQDMALRALNRADLLLRDDVDLVDALVELEDVHHILAAFREDDDMFGKGKVAVPLPALVFRALELHIRLDELVTT